MLECICQLYSFKNALDELFIYDKTKKIVWYLPAIECYLFLMIFSNIAKYLLFFLARFYAEF